MELEGCQEDAAKSSHPQPFCRFAKLNHCLCPFLSPSSSHNHPRFPSFSHAWLPAFCLSRPRRAGLSQTAPAHPTPSLQFAAGPHTRRRTQPSPQVFQVVLIHHSRLWGPWGCKLCTAGRGCRGCVKASRHHRSTGHNPLETCRYRNPMAGKYVSRRGTGIPA